MKENYTNKMPAGVTLQVFYDNELYFQSSEHWLKPLYELESFMYENPVEDKSLLSLHDSVDGRAAAILTCRLGIKKVYSETISCLAISVFERNGVKWDSANVIDRILCKTEDFITEEMSPDYVHYILKKRLD